ncbi:MAG: hypothetical protein KUG67_03550 [Proteobacteria bacterium]|nr:hypothetical protein [Pseudomonadota bacterium]
MGKKYLAVTKINCLSHYTKEEAEGDAYFEKWDKLAVELKALLKKYDIDFVEHETQFLNKKKNSLCQCDECKRWMTDREKNPVGMNSEHPTLIYNGASYKGKNLCEMCLPEDHRWDCGGEHSQSGEMVVGE